MLRKQFINLKLSTQFDGINIPHTTFYISMKDVKKVVADDKVAIVVTPGPNPTITYDPNQPSVSKRTFHF